jgi:hypothetical protein
MTAVASHRIPGRRQRRDLAEARSRAQRSLGCASGGRSTRPKECEAARSGPGGASPPRPRARIAGSTPSVEAGPAEAGSVSACSRPMASPVAKCWPNSRLGKAIVAARTQRHAPSFTPSAAEASERMRPRRGDPGRSRDLGGKEALRDVRDRSREHPPELSRGGMRARPPKQSGHASSSRGSPPIGTPPRWRTDARRAARGIRRQLPWGSGPFGVSGSGKHCPGLPHRGRPLSGFLTPSAV